MYTARTEENFIPMGTARTRRPKDLRAGAFQPAINSFTLHLNAEGKSPKTVRTYAGAEVA